MIESQMKRNPGYIKSGFFCLMANTHYGVCKGCSTFHRIKFVTVIDPACGTGGMLSVAEEYLHSLNASTELVSFGQEINDQQPVIRFQIGKLMITVTGMNVNVDTKRMLHNTVLNGW